MERVEEHEEDVRDGEDAVHESPFPGSRLMIKEMVLENFKSYAGEVRIGPFHKCFSSVVGPNGSGKSNTIDAMLFVFGKRAKKLRLNKVSELIHSSTDHPNCEYAKVTVYFHNIIDRDSVDADDEGYDIVPDSELEVSRIAYQSNKSDYYVDGKKYSFTEVSKLLMKRGIDLQNNRFLILQGEVEQISLMKPKAPSEHEDGLLEYLEDIIGSNQYTEAIQQASTEVEELSEVRAQELNRVKIVEKDRESLEDAKNEAEAYLQKNRLLIQKRAWRVQMELTKAEASSSENIEKRDALQARIQEEESTIESSQESREGLLKELQDAQKQYENHLTYLNSQQKEFKAFEEKDIKFQEDKKHAEATIKELETLSNKQAKLAEKHANAAKKQREIIPELEDQDEELKDQRKQMEMELEKVYESLQGKTSKLRAELESKQGSLAPLSQKVSQAKSKLEVVLTEIELVESSVTTSKEKLEKAQEKIEALEISTKSRPEEIKLAEQDLKKAKKDLERVTSQLEKVQTRENELDKQVRDKRGATEVAKASLAQSSSRSILLSTLAEAKADKGNPISDAGLEGRLGDLGSIDPKYDVAISTACGQLNNLVTTTTKGAETCVKYLREHNIGRATFYILEKLKVQKRMEMNMETPEGVPRLFDLVQPAHDKFRPAFYQALGDTLVAKDLDQAVRIAYEGNQCKYRVVTLTGQLIDKSGTMSGGGGKPRRGLIKLLSSSKQTVSMDEEEEHGLVSKESVAELERNTAALFEELVQCRQERQRLSKEKIRLEGVVSDLELMIPKMAVELEEMTKQIEQLSSNIKDLEPLCELSSEDALKLDSLKEQKEDFQQMYTDAQADLSALEAETSSLHQKIADIGGPKVVKLKEKIDEVERAMEKNRKALNKANSDVKALTIKSEKALAAQQEALAEIVQHKDMIEALQSEFKLLEDGALVVMQEVEQAKQKEQEYKATLTELQQQHSEYQAKSNKIKKVLVEMKIQLNDYNEQAQQNQVVLDNLQKKMKELKSQHALLVERAAIDEKRKKKEQQAAKRPKISTEQEEKGDEVESTDPVEAQNDNDDGDLSAKSDDEEEKDKQDQSSEDQLLLQPEQLDELDVNLLGVEIQQLESEVNKLKNVVNLGAIKEYLERDREYRQRVDALEGATKVRDDARERCEGLRKKRLTEFMAGFSQITLKLKEMYQMITLGGDAELELVDSCDPFSEGIVFSVRPPKKSWKNISNLSGGEKTLSSLALVFALHHYKPTPLYVMDEIDAALDHKNVSIVGNYIKERTKNAQFIIISLRNNMFELADRLVGIYKTHDATKSITINPSKVVASSLQKANALNAPRQPLAPVNR